MSHPMYVLGSSPRELSRLSLQAIIRPVTSVFCGRQELRRSRVLDLGCGVGDASMLAAEIVGPSGSVVGIDQSAEAIAEAEARVRDSGFQQIDFKVSAVEAFSSDEPFDAVIGRYVLIHQVVPADFIRVARRHVRPEGVIAFHELSCHREFHSLPVSPLFEEVAELLKIAATAGFASYDAAGRLVEHFREGGSSSSSIVCRDAGRGRCGFKPVRLDGRDVAISPTVAGKAGSGYRREFIDQHP